METMESRTVDRLGGRRFLPFRVVRSVSVLQRYSLYLLDSGLIDAAKEGQK